MKPLLHYSKKLAAKLGTEWMPFADVATVDLPLPRLLRLSLFQLSIGLATALLVGTLNRVMIVENQALPRAYPRERSWQQVW